MRSPAPIARLAPLAPFLFAAGFTLGGPTPAQALTLVNCNVTFGWQCYPAAPILQFAPSTLAFPMQAIGTTSAPQSITMHLPAGYQPVGVGNRWTTGDFSMTSDCPTGLYNWPVSGWPTLMQPGADCTFQVRFAPTGPGLRTGTLVVRDTSWAWNVHMYYGTYTLDLSGLAPSAEVSASPTALDFGVQQVGVESAPQAVTFTNTGEWTLAISSITATGDFAVASSCPARLAQGVSCAVAVAFKPSASGAATGVLRIVGDAVNSPVEIALSGSGSANALLANTTGLWGDTHEDGWGVSFNQQGDAIFASLYTYGTDGRPLWLFASGMARQADGSFAGDLYRASAGPPFAHAGWSAIAMAREGGMSLRFNDDGSATLVYSVGAVTRVKTVQATRFGPEATRCAAGPVSRATATNYQDLWWNPAEPGWGLNLAHQGNIVFASLFTFGEDGRNTWYFASGLALQPGGAYTGALYTATGPSFAAPAWGAISLREVGTMTLRFSDGERGTVSYVVDGRAMDEPIVRYVFGSSAPNCR
ncbi:MAG TPA: choice-of-anchor D domain-containing protein [Usitatibacter sp.]|nr:choice-of-anchor D domain-containing protein [Usitatibacter sp.]